MMEPSKLKPFNLQLLKQSGPITLTRQRNLRVFDDALASSDLSLPSDLVKMDLEGSESTTDSDSDRRVSIEAMIRLWADKYISGVGLYGSALRSHVSAGRVTFEFCSSRSESES